MCRIEQGFAWSFPIQGRRPGKGNESRPADPEQTKDFQMTIPSFLPIGVKPEISVQRALTSFLADFRFFPTKLNR
jgi:hypothetical protein